MTALNKDWLDRLLHEVEELSLALVTEEQHELPAVVRHFGDRLEPAPDPAHTALLSTVMLDVCRHTFDSLHASLSHDRCSCGAESWAMLPLFTRWYETDPRAAVCSWTDAFFRAYQRNHPPTMSTRAAAMMRKAPANGWTITTIARRLGVTPRTLSVEFRERFGIGPLEYLHLARIAQTLAALEEPIKIEALVVEMGYRSKKDFYRAFRTWTGTTPTTVRGMQAEARRILTASVRARCLWGDCRVPSPLPSAARFEYDGFGRAAAG